MSKEQPTVAITGANGFVGGELVRYFTDKGWRVVALVRKPKDFKETKLISYRAYDLTKPVASDLLKGVDYLVHTAFIKYDRKHPEALKMNVKAAEDLLANAKKHNVKKSVFMSSMSAHDEAVSIYGKQKLAVEDVFAGPNGVSLRSGLILGNGGIVKQMAGFIKSKHVVPLVDGGKQPLQVIGVYDLARVIDAAFAPKINGTFTVAHPQVYSYRQFYQALGKRLDTKVFFVPVPFGLLLGAMRTVSALHLPLAVNEDNLWGLKKLRAAETEKDLKKLGVALDDLEKVLNHPGIIAG
ncbi:MAG TPA: NAD-dependent epimerase/dehydratase family protein [Candidatus Saccharimonadales bacterium]